MLRHYTARPSCSRTQRAPQGGIWPTEVAWAQMPACSSASSAAAAQSTKPCKRKWGDANPGNGFSLKIQLGVVWLTEEGTSEKRSSCIFHCTFHCVFNKETYIVSLY